MASKDVDIDDTVFLQRVAALARNLGEEQAGFIKNQTGILAREVARMTPPYASYPKLTNTASVGSLKDITQGKIAITGDLYKICQIKSLADVKRARKAFGTGPVNFGFQSGGGTIINEAEFHAWHKKNLYKGRNRTRKVTYYSRYWVTQTVFNRYAKSQHLYVGRAKATFYKAALKLGARVTAPANVKNNALLVSSSGRVNTTGDFSEGVIKGKAGGLYHTIRHLPMLKSNRLIKAVKRGEYLLKQAAKDANFNVV
jgi:hypothetical protein